MITLFYYFLDSRFLNEDLSADRHDDLMALRVNAGVDQLIPGITGWTQVNGRDEIALEEKVGFEKEYLERKSFWFDLKIIVLTFAKVLKSQGVKH